MTADAFEATAPYLDRVEQDILEAEQRFSYASHMLDAVDEALALVPRSRDDLRTCESVQGQTARRVDRLRDRLAKAVLGVTSAVTATLTVKELAEAIGQSDGSTRRLLDKGLIPDARRKTPNVKNSPWIIPATAPAAYLAHHNGKDTHAPSVA